MYKINELYRFETRKGLFFTGEVKEETDLHILIETIRNEEIILLKSDIIRATNNGKNR